MENILTLPGVIFRLCRDLDDSAMGSLLITSSRIRKLLLQQKNVVFFVAEWVVMSDLGKSLIKYKSEIMDEKGNIMRIHWFKRLTNCLTMEIDLLFLGPVVNLHDKKERNKIFSLKSMIKDHRWLFGNFKEMCIVQYHKHIQSDYGVLVNSRVTIHIIIGEKHEQEFVSTCSTLEKYVHYFSQVIVEQMPDCN